MTALRLKANGIPSAADLLAYQQRADTALKRLLEGDTPLATTILFRSRYTKADHIVGLHFNSVYPDVQVHIFAVEIEGTVKGLEVTVGGKTVDLFANKYLDKEGEPTSYRQTAIDCVAELMAERVRETYRSDVAPTL